MTTTILVVDDKASVRQLLTDYLTQHAFRVVAVANGREALYAARHENPDYLDAAIRILRTFDYQHIRDFPAVHKRIGVPVQLVWGSEDRFFPVTSAQEMISSFPDARLHVVRGAGLFSHEERPAEVAEALLPTLLGTR